MGVTVASQEYQVLLVQTPEYQFGGRVAKWSGDFFAAVYRQII
jgi:hypothetical protein